MEDFKSCVEFSRIFGNDFELYRIFMECLGMISNVLECGHIWGQGSMSSPACE